MNMKNLTPLLIAGALGLAGVGMMPLVKAFRSLDSGAKTQVTMVIIVTIILILVSGFLTLTYLNKKISDKNKEKGKDEPLTPPLSVSEFLNGASPTLKTILVGMASGLVFGFIDNAGLYFGMDKLDPLFEAMGAGPLAKSGLGNTFSDMLGGFIGTFAGIVIQTMSGVSDTPIWSEAVGLIIGCLLGVFIPAAFMKKKFSD